MENKKELLAIKSMRLDILNRTRNKSNKENIKDIVYEMTIKNIETNDIANVVNKSKTYIQKLQKEMGIFRYKRDIELPINKVFNPKH